MFSFYLTHCYSVTFLRFLILLSHLYCFTVLFSLESQESLTPGTERTASVSISSTAASTGANLAAAARTFELASTTARRHPAAAREREREERGERREERPTRGTDAEAVVVRVSRVQSAFSCQGFAQLVIRFVSFAASCDRT